MLWVCLFLLFCFKGFYSAIFLLRFSITKFQVFLRNGKNLIFSAHLEKCRSLQLSEPFWISYNLKVRSTFFLLEKFYGPLWLCKFFYFKSSTSELTVAFNARNLHLQKRHLDVLKTFPSPPSRPHFDGKSFKRIFCVPFETYRKKMMQIPNLLWTATCTPTDQNMQFIGKYFAICI